MKPFALSICFLLLAGLVTAQTNAGSRVGATPRELPIAKAAFATLKLPGSPDFLAPDGDDVWILNIDRVEKLSVKSDKPVLSVTIPGACGALIVGFHSVWVASCGTQSIYRVDKESGKLLSIIPCPISDRNGEIMLAAGAGSIWVLSDRAGVLTRIDPRKNAIQTTIAVEPDSHCAVFDFGAVWITNTAGNSVQRIDPGTNRVVATIPVGKTPRFLAAGEKGVWTLNQGDGTVSHIDPGQNKVVAVVDAKVPGSGGDIAAGAGCVWVRAKGRLLETINPASNAVQTIYTPVAGSGAVRVTTHFIWVTAHDINTIWVLKR
jgi:YVTN family beta-propeller protein